MWWRPCGRRRGWERVRLQRRWAGRLLPSHPSPGPGVRPPAAQCRPQAPAKHARSLLCSALHAEQKALLKEQCEQMVRRRGCSQAGAPHMLPAARWHCFKLEGGCGPASPLAPWCMQEGAFKSFAQMVWSADGQHEVGRSLAAAGAWGRYPPTGSCKRQRPGATHAPAVHRLCRRPTSAIWLRCWSLPVASWSQL